MKKNRIFSARLIAAPAALILLSLAAGCVSLAADVTPPPDYTPPAPVNGTAEGLPTATAIPLLPPDTARGAEIFAQKCAACHGPEGLSDGEMSAQLPNLPPQIGKREVGLRANPADWFRLVSVGNLERMMPGFSGSLDERARWDVVAYALSLTITQEDLIEGRELFEAYCSACHALDEEAHTDLGDPGRLAGITAEQIAAVIEQGQGKMPPIGGLSEEERLSLAQFTRNLSFSAPVVPDALTPSPVAGEAGAAPTAADGMLILQGRLTSESGDQPVAGLKVTLSGYAGMSKEFDLETAAAPDGAFRFEVQNRPDMIYVAEVTVDGQKFNSEILHSRDITSSTAEMPITIYSSTTDASGLYAERMHLFFDFSTPGKVQVVELFLISNPGQRVIVPAGSSEPILSIALPAGAEELQLDGGDLGGRFVSTADGFGEMQPIRPGIGQHQVLFAYSLPYRAGLALDVPLPLKVNAAVVMLPVGSVKLASQQLAPAGQRQVQDLTYDLYTAGAVTSTLHLELSGKPGGGGMTSDGQWGVAIGAAALGLVVAAIGIWLIRRKQTAALAAAAPVSKSEARKAVEENLLDQILRLEDQRKAGKLTLTDYTRQRQQLVNQLKNLRRG